MKWQDKVEEEIKQFIKKQFPGLDFYIILDNSNSVSNVFLIANPKPKCVKIHRLPKFSLSSKVVKAIIKNAKVAISSIVKPKLELLVEFVKKARVEPGNFSYEACFLWFSRFSSFLFEKRYSVEIDDEFVEGAKKTVRLVENLKKIFSKKIFRLVLRNFKGVLTEGFQVIFFDRGYHRMNFEPFLIPFFLVNTLFEVNSLEEFKKRAREKVLETLEEIMKTWE